MPNFLHRVLAAGGAAIALALGVNQLALHGLAAPLLCAGPRLGLARAEALGRSGELWRPVGYGLVLALLLVETFRLFGVTEWFGLGGEAPGWMRIHGPLIGRALTAALLVLVAIVIALREGHPPTGRVTLAAAGGALLLGLLSLGAPGLASALLILLLGFAAGNRILMALGILSLLGFVEPFLLQPARDPARQIGAARGDRPVPARRSSRSPARSPAQAAEPGHA